MRTRYYIHYFVLFILFISTKLVIAQNPIAQLKFEDAEKAFNEGNYLKSIQYINETEELVGVTSKTLYLKIVAQDKLIESDLSQHFDLIEKLKNNTNKYLEALKNNEIDDKYRMVYEVSKRVKEYPASKADLDNGYIQSNKPFSGSSSEVNQVLNAYLKALASNAHLNNIKTVIIETEIFQDDKLLSTVIDKKTIGKHYSEVRLSNNSSTKTVYNNGKGYTTAFGTNVPMSAEVLELHKNLTSSNSALISHIIDAGEFVNASCEKTIFIGEEVTAVKTGINEFYFSQNNHLLLGQKTNLANTNYQLITYKDYRAVDGILFPFTVLTQTVSLNQPVSTSEATAKLINQFSNNMEVSGVVTVGLFGSKKKKKENGKSLNNANLAKQIMELANQNRKTTAQIKYVKINQPIPNSDFE